MLVFNNKHLLFCGVTGGRCLLLKRMEDGMDLTFDHFIMEILIFCRGQFQFSTWKIKPLSEGP